MGERVHVAIPDDVLARIDAVLHAASERYDRVPRELRSRSALIRACVDGELWRFEGRVFSRPLPDSG